MTESKPDNVLVEYVGLKPKETDHLYGTGITWLGQGDVHEVPRKAWTAGMHKHPDVWRLVEVATAQATVSTATEGAPMVIVTGERATDLRTLDRDTLFALATEKGLDPHPQLGKAKLLQLLGA